MEQNIGVGTSIQYDVVCRNNWQCKEMNGHFQREKNEKQEEANAKLLDFLQCIYVNIYITD